MKPIKLMLEGILIIIISPLIIILSMFIPWFAEGWTNKLKELMAEIEKETK